MPRVRTTILIAALTLSGCVTPAQMVERHVAEVSAQPQAFRDGYRDGCTSGYAAANYYEMRFTKDARRYDSDRQYAGGWEDGFRVCRSRAQGS